jgi:hypothetical protein
MAEPRFKKIAFYFLSLLMIQMLFVYSEPSFAVANSNESTSSFSSSITKIVSFSIIIDDTSYFDQLVAWLRILNFRNFTFVVVEGTTNGYILENATRLNLLKQYGEIIPRLSLMQAYSPDNRIFNANFTLNEFTKALGYTPKGVMDFIPDSYTAQYLLSRGVEYYQGYCFDQYQVDRMTMRGGFQMPYYANASNILCPNTVAGGMVVLPHSTWDWADSFTVSHNLQLHPLNLLNMAYQGNQTAENYLLSLIDNTFAGSSPFGYVTVQFEWSWLYQYGGAQQALDWIKTLISSRISYRYLTFGETVDWFKDGYNQTPTYRINFTSPYDGENIEWYYDLSSRIARSGADVVSYVDYIDQQPDRYLTSYSPIFWADPANSTNSIDDSLSFKIDALGGGYLRANVSTLSIPYDGDIASFGAYYSELTIAKQQTGQVLTFSLACAAVASVAVFVVVRRKRMSSKERT